MTDSDTKVLNQLNEHMGIEGAVRFEAGAGGLFRAVLTAGGGEVHVYRYAAHVTHFQPAGHEPVIFVSDASHFEPTKAIRGGVPICFPWFADNVPDSARTAAGESAPMHGFARNTFWKFRSVDQLDDGSVQAVLALKSSPNTHKLWPHHFVATYTITLSGDGQTLTMKLWVKHKGPADAEPFTYDEALHTYFNVGDIHNTSITGLDGATFTDKVDNLATKTQPDEPIRFTSETDRVYHNTVSTCVIHDDASKRRIVVEKEGSNSTIVWNPWIEKAARMPDFGNDEWPRMLCIETANVADHAITLKAGESHAMTAKIHAESMP